MRVKQITVNKLFGMFNHTIPLNQEERITIIHGPNGFGKTTILRLIDGVLNSNYSALRSIPFESFQILFDTGDAIEVRKSIERHSSKEADFTRESRVTISVSGANAESEEFQLPTNQDLRQNLHWYSRIDIPGLSQVGPTQWIVAGTNEELTSLDVVERYSDFFPSPFTLENQKVRKRLSRLQGSVNVWFIQTQRLFILPRNPARRPRTEEHWRSASVTPEYVSVVSEYSKELAASIEATLGEYATISQSLDRTFPTRLLEKQYSQPLTDEELRDKLNNLEEKRASLTKAGLLDPAQDADFRTQQISEITAQNKSVLAVYVEDVERKLGVFNELATKIEFFKTIVNERFLYKRMDIDKNGGISLTTNDGYLLSPSNLSSGEQHELVLFYNLLFKVTPNSLILIDEPEISLHVSWQEQFLRDIQKVAQLSEFDVLIATHSPEIIADKWNLTVALEKPQKLPSNNSNGKQKRQRQSAVTVK